MVQADNDTAPVAHRLPIGADELERVLMRLRRDSVDQQIRWTLGDYGACELDATFLRVASGGPVAFAARGRLWDRAHLALAPVAIVISIRTREECEIEARPGALAPWWQRHPDQYRRLARAAVEELVQELLWCATTLRREQRA
ncbi:MAG TPA: hypothetical protein VFZ83_07500 [Acidimicrobiia bacterium]|nr:hypothetical protein [Acidimicrobiia bacterium]